MLDCEVIRPIDGTTWLANPVFIRKPNGQWRMCIDFTTLNKYCSKDDFPIARIDQLVDATAGCAMISFLDGYSGFHQVWLALEDQPLTAFQIPGGVYCYNRMPFGLKNVSATFSRTIKATLGGGGDQLGRNDAAYIDDNVIKST